MFYKSIILIAIISFLLLGCNNSNNSNGIAEVKYDFPEKTIIKNVEDDACFQKFGEKEISIASNIERGLVNMFGGDIDIEEQAEIGLNYHNELKKVYNFIEDERHQKLERILNKIKPFTSLKHINYQIFLIEDPNEPDILNAFTHIGGYIYVTTKLLEFVSSEDELAFIIGHEVGHNENEHVLLHIKRSEAIKPIAGEYSNHAAGLLSMIITSYNQSQELVSDRAGTYLAYKLGYEPDKGLDFFRKMGEKEEVSWLKTFLSSHPYSTSREQCGTYYLESNEVK